ncbi:GM25067 [Drosophila sechellia]|uniref:GM25067 n=1 Tax=Drosophila sechellia TaxID=7238 RepID=B4HJZ5_DROSE|nr:GM25067 [Drosophila sechellia]
MVYVFLSVAGNYVSLPGAGTGPTEQPTILLINGIASDLQLEDKQSKAAALKLALDNNNSEASATAQPHQVPTTPGGSHLLDFESHLIESIADQASGVGIRELTPFEQNCSRVHPRRAPMTRTQSSR